MPNTSVPAAAEGAPIFQDPLLILIREYRLALADFERNHPREDVAGADAYADATYGPFLARLQQWCGPATSMEGAIEALRLCMEDEFAIRRTDTVDRMVAAALAFLEKQATRHGDQAKQPMTYGDLENPICELVSMARVAEELLDQVFEAAPPKGGFITVSLNRDQIDAYSFAYKNVLDRAIDLKQAFYAAAYARHWS
ncbi:hypothetical protein CO657_13575 [Rhizobium acidisoli]|uniref:Uncharacterized protein n=1 Tax=Rhizobium acidisoli TaxID=1538158 RepID=A0AAE5TW27_9HYPH|nr:hypothetical protein [Rhizobium acidisoli]KPH08856.1 hypothetical protein AOG23_10075 [Rhizobium acidisoli]QAS79033.1 hypothetical protein CO657_13575 [Rhizobium acidisoli]